MAPPEAGEPQLWSISPI